MHLVKAFPRNEVQASVPDTMAADIPVVHSQDSLGNTFAAFVTQQQLTLALATAVTILAPSLAIPPASYLRPTMKPMMFCKKINGVPRCAHSCTKWAPA